MSNLNEHKQFMLGLSRMFETAANLQANMLFDSKKKPIPYKDINLGSYGIVRVSKTGSHINYGQVIDGKPTVVELQSILQHTKVVSDEFSEMIKELEKREQALVDLNSLRGQLSQYELENSELKDTVSELKKAGQSLQSTVKRIKEERDGLSTKLNNAIEEGNTGWRYFVYTGGSLLVAAIVLAIMRFS